jgi:hypothetical protein
MAEGPAALKDARLAPSTAKNLSGARGGVFVELDSRADKVCESGDEVKILLHQMFF